MIELQLKVAAFVVHSGEKHLSPSVFVVGFTTLGAVKEEAEIALILKERKKEVGINYIEGRRKRAEFYGFHSPNFFRDDRQATLPLFER